MAEVRITAQDGSCLRLEGVLSFATVPTIVVQGATMVAQCAPQVVIDLGGVERADSAGLALLVEWMRVARRRRKSIVFRAMPEQMLAMARVSDLDRILPLE
ncbi:MAG: lipid asymmetry maintenance protein MlaB [Gammaproteobacteria bacterium]